MNARLLYPLLFATSLCLSASLPLSAKSRVESPAAYSVRSVTASPGNYRIERGASQVDVAWALQGKFLRILSPNCWAYSSFRTAPISAIEHQCDTVLINFSRGRVSEILLVNQPALFAFASSLDSAASVARR